MTWISTSWNDLPIYHPTHLIAILASTVLAITALECTYKSQHETILADLNWYTTATSLVIIVTDDAIKHTCIRPLAWWNKYKAYNSLTPVQQSFTFRSPVKEKGKQWMMKGHTMCTILGYDILLLLLMYAKLLTSYKLSYTSIIQNGTLLNINR